MHNTDHPHSAWLSLGSNLGERIKNLEKACDLLNKGPGRILRLSGYYESESWGYESRNAFLNCCLELQTALEPGSLMDAILDIENRLGRRRTAGSKSAGSKSAGTGHSPPEGGYSDRCIDIDILFYGQLVMNDTKLVLPHPYLSARRFVLMPLAEIAPLLKHPLFGLSVEELLSRCPDKAPVRRL